jgi:hypothetical protein
MAYARGNGCRVCSAGSDSGDAGKRTLQIIIRIIMCEFTNNGRNSSLKIKG